MKKLIIGLVIVLGFGLYLWQSESGTNSGLLGGSDFAYTSPTIANSTINPYAWTSVLSTDTSRSYVELCNNSITANDAFYLYFGTASTTANDPAKPIGYRLASGSCFQMTGENMYWGTVYAIASTATSTLLKLYK